MCQCPFVVMTSAEHSGNLCYSLGFGDRMYLRIGATLLRLFMHDQMMLSLRCNGSKVGYSNDLPRLSKLRHLLIDCDCNRATDSCVDFVEYQGLHIVCLCEHSLHSEHDSR